MDINWYGQSFFRIKGKNASVLIDPFNPELTGLKFPKDISSDIVLSSHSHPDHNFFDGISGQPLVITGPGEYEKSGVSIMGIKSFHDSANGEERGLNTIYNIMIDNINIVHLGDLGHVLTEALISEIGNTDILMIPVGGVYTINGEKASKIVSQLEPRVIIPMHYKIEGLKFDLENLDPFLKDMGVESYEPTPKLTITKDKLPDQNTIIVLSKTI